jgi:hypothetical protein
MTTICRNALAPPFSPVDNWEQAWTPKECIHVAVFKWALRISAQLVLKQKQKWKTPINSDRDCSGKKYFMCTYYIYSQYLQTVLDQKGAPIRGGILKPCPCRSFVGGGIIRRSRKADGVETTFEPVEVALSAKICKAR